MGSRSVSGRSLRRAARSGPAGRELRASAGRRLRPARPFQGRNSKFKIQNSKLWNRCATCKGTARADLQTRNAGLRRAKLWPANRCTIDLVQKARSRADGPVTERSSPPPGGGCGLLRLQRSRKFSIQDSKFSITKSRRSLRRLRSADLYEVECTGLHSLCKAEIHDSEAPPKTAEKTRAPGFSPDAPPYNRRLSRPAIALHKKRLGYGRRD